MDIKDKLKATIEKAVIFRTDKIGDMILTLPMFRALKEWKQDLHLTLISSSYTNPVTNNCEFIDEIINLDKLDRSLIETLRNGKFQAVFFPRPRYREALASFNAGIKNRIGSGYRLYSFLFNHRVYEHRKSGEKHEAEYNVNLINHFTHDHFKPILLKPSIDTKALSVVRDILKKVNPEGKKFIIIHPGSGGSSLEWSAGKFGELSNLITSKSNMEVVITGTISELAKCNEVSSMNSKSINIANKLSLDEMIALISLSSGMVANSTGVIHIGASLGIPVVGIYPNEPHLSSGRWGPYTKNSLVLSPDLSDRSNNLEIISSSQAFEALEKLKII